MSTFIRQPLAVLVVAALIPASAAFAQSADAGRAAQVQAELQKRFAAADANGDGRLTRDEAKGKMPLVYKHFDEIDTAHSGGITLADIAAFAIAQRAARPGAQ
ncbi:MAG: EF-hand domain-containing protein [Burkholderiales bacterium]